MMAVGFHPPSTDTIKESADKVVSETINAALDQLHLDDVVNSEPLLDRSDPHSAFADGNIPAGHIYPIPQMFNMGYMPYSQMMPIAGQTGFHPPPSDYDNISINSNTVGIPSGAAPGTASSFPRATLVPQLVGAPGSSIPPISESTIKAIDNTVSSKPAMNPTEGTMPYQTINPLTKIAASNLMASNEPNAAFNLQGTGSLWKEFETNSAFLDSSAIADADASEHLEQHPMPFQVSGAASSPFRRQTFHAISTHDLVDAARQAAAGKDLMPNNLKPDDPINSFSAFKNRTQSISFDTKNLALFDQVTNLASNTIPAKDADSSQKGVLTKTQKIKPKAFNDITNYATAAYPYGGPMMGTNHGYSPHPPLSPANFVMGSPYPGKYDFSAPFQPYSVGMSAPNHGIHPHSPIHMSYAAAQQHSFNELKRSGNYVDGQENNFTGINHPMPTPPLPQGFSMLQSHPSSPPPWMYGTPPPFMPPSPGLGQAGSNHQINPQKFSDIDQEAGGIHSKSRRNKNATSYQYEAGPKSFKANDAMRYVDASLDQYIGNIFSLCGDQHGCRFLQKELDLLGKDAADAIFEEIKDHTVELMTDSFGNYLIQKLLEKVTSDQRVVLANIAAPHFVEIALNPHGTRALQKMIECVRTPQESKIIVENLRESVVVLSKDLNGNHVIQKCLQKLSSDDSQFVFDAACKDFNKIATHRHGCCVLQRCFDHGSQQQCTALCEQLLASAYQLTLDPFGNYVVQYGLGKEAERKDFQFVCQIAEILKSKIVELSLHKFGSNVIEKLLRTPSVSEILIGELISHGEKDIKLVLNDSYGNYVLQTSLYVSRQHNQKLYTALSDLVSPLLVGQVRNTPHGKRIMAMLHIE